MEFDWFAFFTLTIFTNLYFRKNSYINGFNKSQLLQLQVVYKCTDLKNYNGKYILYYVEHYKLSDKILELHSVENYTIE